MGRKVVFLLFLGLWWAVPADADVASDIFEAVSPSVVVVHALDAKGSQVSLGSGVALSAEEVVTNCHVLEDGIGYRVVYRSQTYPAELKHSDWDRDVCSLAVSGLEAKPAILIRPRDSQA